MTRSRYLRLARAGLAALALLLTGVAAAQERPNVVLIITDDQGYGDLGCFGATGYTTPHLDRLAREGRRFTSFYVAQAVCSASRVALMTGCYSNRVGILGALGPRSKIGINPDEQILPELLKARGYATCAIGKWHLGDRPEFLPTRHGFDEYYGLPYSNDMWPSHPTSKAFPRLPLVENETVINPDVTAEDQTHLTHDYAERAVAFIEAHKDGPFFVYLAHSMPHVPLAAGAGFAGTQPGGLYGDVIHEIDASVGRIVETLAATGNDRRTLILFMTDNGPWLSYGNHAGSAGPLREGKGTAWEGGVRVPMIAWMPGRVPAGTTCEHIAATIDIVPTLCALTGAEPPTKPVDGTNISSLLTDESPGPAREEYAYWYGQELRAIRAGNYKLVFPHAYQSLTGAPGRDGRPDGYTQKRCGLELYDLAADVGETTDVAAAHPDVVADLTARADRYRSALGDKLTETAGSENRPAGTSDGTPLTDRGRPPAAAGQGKK